MVSEIKWKAFEYKYRHKGADWYWCLWILALGAFITSYIFNNILFGIFILLSAFSLSLYASKRPSLINFTLSEKGILINDKLIPYSDLESFWVADSPNPPGVDGSSFAKSMEDKQGKILFKAKKKTSPYIIIPLPKDTVDAEEIKEYLLKRLKEVEHREPFLQTVIEKLGF
ncbi:MAG: hypothetical protein KAV41_02290 [Candidatus Pacebacteria bacterium]|nr:hypothetical protein [Candidatus Paceibacterota bacterium]